MTNNFELERKRGFLIAGIGACVSIVAFLVLPFVTLTITTTPINPGSQSTSENIPAGTGLISLLTGVIWIAALLAIGALIAVIIGAYKLTSSENSVPPTRLRNIAYTTIGLSIAGIVFQFLFVSVGNSQLNTLMQNTTVNSGGASVTLADLISRGSNVSLSMSFTIGSWLYLIGLVVAIVGGVLVLRTITVPGVVAQQPQQGWQAPTQYQNQSQPTWQQPPQPPQVQQPAQLQEVWHQPSGSQPTWQQPPQVQQPAWQQPSGPQPAWQQPSGPQPPQTQQAWRPPTEPQQPWQQQQPPMR